MENMASDNDAFRVNMALKKYLEDHHISQADLLRLCKKKGRSVSQGNLSKVLSGQKKISVEECMAFCKALDISADMLLFSDSDRSRRRSEGFFSLPEEMLPAVSGMLGEYEILYASTAAEEEGSLIDGSLKLYQKNQSVYAQVEIRTGHSVTKKYKGFFVVYPYFPTAYIMVKNKESGEICMMALRYRAFNVENMLCRMALCLTTSAGEKKQPIAHRMILVRKGQIAEKAAYEKWKKDASSFLKEDKGFQLEREEDMALFQMLRKIKEK